MRNISTTTKHVYNYNPHNNSHFLLPQDYFPAVKNWVKLRYGICRWHCRLSLNSSVLDSSSKSIGEEGLRGGTLSLLLQYVSNKTLGDRMQGIAEELIVRLGDVDRF
jgi:hypothetical protein